MRKSAKKNKTKKTRLTRISTQEDTIHYYEVKIT